MSEKRAHAGGEGIQKARVTKSKTEKPNENKMERNEIDSSSIQQGEGKENTIRIAPLQGLKERQKTIHTSK